MKQAKQRAAPAFTTKSLMAQMKISGTFVVLDFVDGGMGDMAFVTERNKRRLKTSQAAVDRALQRKRIVFHKPRFCKPNPFKLVLARDESIRQADILALEKKKFLKMFHAAFPGEWCVVM